MTNKTELTLGEWALAGIPTFDHSAEFEERVQPLITQLHDECVKLGIPLLVMAAYAQDKEGVQMFRKIGITDDIGRMPTAILCALHAARAEWDEMDEVITASAVRMSCATAPATKH